MLLGVLILLFMLLLTWQLLRKPTAKPAALPVALQQTNRYPLVMLPSRPIRAIPPVRIEGQRPQKGISEDYFFTYLRRYFPGCVFNDMALRIQSDYYFPDFAFFYEPQYLWIDLEIDEPYALPEQTPTHYLGADTARNNFFLERGWIVLRFTEEQVVRQPLACCRFLAEILEKITGDSSFLDALYAAPPLHIRPHPWTIVQSRNMAACRTRQSYLHLVR